MKILYLSLALIFAILFQFLGLIDGVPFALLVAFILYLMLYFIIPKASKRSASARAASTVIWFIVISVTLAVVLFGSMLVGFIAFNSTEDNNSALIEGAKSNFEEFTNLKFPNDAKIIDVRHRSEFILTQYSLVLIASDKDIHDLKSTNIAFNQRKIRKLKESEFSNVLQYRDFVSDCSKNREDDITKNILSIAHFCEATSGRLEALVAFKETDIDDKNSDQVSGFIIVFPKERIIWIIRNFG